MKLNVFESPSLILLPLKTHCRQSSVVDVDQAVLCVRFQLFYFQVSFLWAAG